MLLGLFSIVTLLADRLHQQETLLVNTTAWYQKEKPTFRAAMAAVRKLLWQKFDSSTSTKQAKMVNIPKPLLHHLKHMLAHAA